MKVLITKSDGTPTKSKVHALQFLEKKGISKELLIEENGQFFYEDAEAEVKPVKAEKLGQTSYSNVTWETPVFDKNNERTQLVIPGTDVIATINGKHPGGQIRPVSSFEISIGNENFIMSVALIAKIFKVRG